MNLTAEQITEIALQNESLNPEQREGANTLYGPVLLLAGAGAGKTKTMTVRIANLLAAGVSPYEILAMTFTRKAANEMNERLDSMMGEHATEGIWMGTFHSTCVKILRRHGHLLGFDRNEKGYCNFTIYDPNDSFEVVKRIYQQLNYSEKHKEGYALHYMDDCKNKLWDAEFASYHKAETEADQDMSRVYREYQATLLRQNAMDFGDLIMNTVILLRDHPEARDYWQKKFKYVLCDEYQDTNYAQLQLLLLLAAPEFNFFCVGDFRQSIYGFRGSDIGIILSFQQMFPAGKVIYLLKNYRSTASIVEVGNRLIENNVNSLNRDLEANNPAEHKIKVIHLQNEFQEAAYIIAQIKRRMLQVPGSKFKDFAVLYRTNAQSRVIEDICRNQFIPTRVVGGLSFYQREEIKDIVAYLRAIFNEKDDVAMKRILNKPARGIGETTENKVLEYAAMKNISIHRALRATDDLGLNKRAIVKIEGFLALINHLKEKMPEFKTSQQFITYVLEQTGLMKHYMSDKMAEEKVENLQEFLRLIAQYEEQFPEKSIEEFVQEMTLSTDTGKVSDADAVQLMTIHASKGLEFPVVFSIGWSENLFPSQQSRSEAEIEEERRVAYVAVTRAEEELYITHTDTRKQVDGKPKSYQPSRFLSELPSEILEVSQIKL